METGDVVTAFGSNDVQTSGDLLSALRRYGPGESVEATVLRDGEESRLDVRLGELEG
jgi:S1-C subfamily serine protease